MTVYKLDTKIYVSQKAFINKESKVLVLRDPKHAVDGQLGLDFPGGKYRWGKTITEELKREVKEETNLKIKIGKPFITWTDDNYKHHGRNASAFLVGYLCEYDSGEIRLSNEHDYFEWVDEKDYIKWHENTKYFQALEEYFRIKCIPPIPSFMSLL